ncbi:MAG: tRNA pseudouridine(38-40) synthase TruA [Clostridiales bacterium]|jgi:tRNA pseudouridine38-40 synthase|nr:tRNA pseudouridine(38-40) synthase TruA [Clostridiales bacterium]
MKKVRLVIEYDGTNYVGWQTQNNGVSIQQSLETALKKVTKEDISLHASGRTDSGVHALAQVAHFCTEARMPAQKYPFALNALLPGDIRVRYAGDAPQNFHARFDATSKRYRYAVYCGAHMHAFLRHTALHVHGAIDEAALEQTAAAIMGRHDFRAFMAAGSTLADTTREIFFSKWTRAGHMLYYDIEGSGFLYNMVRILVGTMLDIACGTLPIGAIERALHTKLRACAGVTAPARGLTLMHVHYSGFNSEDFVE